MISLMSGGMYHSLWDLFTTDEILTAGFIGTWFVTAYIKAVSREIKDKKLERLLKKKELERKTKMIEDIKNTDVTKFFR